VNQPTLMFVAPGETVGLILDGDSATLTGYLINS